ncbi:MAG: hypothetical protein AAGA35_03230 [Patescibacteria group bacterium]
MEELSKKGRADEKRTLQRQNITDAITKYRELANDPQRARAAALEVMMHIGAAQSTLDIESTGDNALLTEKEVKQIRELAKS